MKRVAAYCRVSTDREDQSSSLESQKKYFLEYIDRNPLWQLAEVYVDQGITGTSTKKRKEFNRMISDAQNKQFDMIITKEISRFARNTLDSIYYTRKLKDLGVGVIFMNDNINTLDLDAELRLTIMSSIAQEESRKTSERVKWGQKRRMEQGNVVGCDNKSVNEKDLKLILQYTIKNIITNKEKVIDELCDSIKRVIGNSTDDKYLKQLNNKINNVSKKRQLLIDMYLNKEVSKTDFHTLTAKYEMELENAKKELAKLKEQGLLYNRQDMLLQKIRSNINLLSCGKQWDDTFYRNIIDKIVVHENKEIEIKLNMLPDDFNGFTINIKDLKRELENANNMAN